METMRRKGLKEGAVTMKKANRVRTLLSIHSQLTLQSGLETGSSFC